MISFYDIKPKFQQLLKPILVKLYEKKVSANQITVLAILLSVSVGALIWVHPFGKTLLIVPAALILRMALNALDGMMARTYNMQSKLGEILNEFGDVVSDTCIYLPFIKFSGVNIYAVFIFILLGILNEFAGVLAKIIGGERRYDGPMGKSDRAFLIGAVSLLYYFWSGISEYINYIFIVAILLLLISTYSRLKNPLK